MNKSINCTVFIAALLLSANTATATPYSYTGTFEVDLFIENTGTEIVMGDIFDFSFTYEDSITDSTAGTSNGDFTNALTNISLIRNPANTGTWDPSGGTFSLPGNAQTATFSSGFFGVRGEGTGFPTLGGFDFDKFALEFSGGVINDTGLGQTLLDQLGGPLDLTGFTNKTAEILALESGAGGAANAIGTITSISLVSAVPVPAAIWLFGSGLLGLVGVARRKNS